MRDRDELDIERPDIDTAARRTTVRDAAGLRSASFPEQRRAELGRIDGHFSFGLRSMMALK
jgi:hypothetical protein